MCGIDARSGVSESDGGVCEIGVGGAASQRAEKHGLAWSVDYSETRNRA